MPSADKPARKPRADSLRNRERLLAAAHDVFSASGPEASLEAVARKAGVGIGTLYRHFPTREALFQAAYAREVDDMAALADRLLTAEDPVEALRQWLCALLGLVETKWGMIAALSPAKGSSDELYRTAAARNLDALDRLLTRASDMGCIRADISASDLMQAVIGLCYAQKSPDWMSTVLRLLDVLVDGLRKT